MGWSDQKRRQIEAMIRIYQRNPTESGRASKKAHWSGQERCARGMQSPKHPSAIPRRSEHASDSNTPTDDCTKPAEKAGLPTPQQRATESTAPTITADLTTPPQRTRQVCQSDNRTNANTLPDDGGHSSLHAGHSADGLARVVVRLQLLERNPPVRRDQRGRRWSCPHLRGAREGRG